jgi:hypothetical protein
MRATPDRRALAGLSEAQREAYLARFHELADPHVTSSGGVPQTIFGEAHRAGLLAAGAASAGTRPERTRSAPPPPPPAARPAPRRERVRTVAPAADDEPKPKHQPLNPECRCEACVEARRKEDAMPKARKYGGDDPMAMTLEAPDLALVHVHHMTAPTSQADAVSQALRAVGASIVNRRPQ